MDETPKADDVARLAELPFAVIALTLANDTNLCDEEIAAAQRGLNALDLPELMHAVREVDHTPTELFELAWLEDNPSSAIAARAALMSTLFSPGRARELCEELSILARLVSAASDRPLKGQDRSHFVRAVDDALGISAS